MTEVLEAPKKRGRPKGSKNKGRATNLGNPRALNELEEVGEAKAGLVPKVSSIPDDPGSLAEPIGPVGVYGDNPIFDPPPKLGTHDAAKCLIETLAANYPDAKPTDWRSVLATLNAAARYPKLWIELTKAE